MGEAQKPELRFEFVGMMFAVAAGEIGIQAADLFRTDLLLHGKTLYALPAISHLLLAAFVIAASWVGWSRSRSSLTIRDVHDVLSRPFVILLLDVFLVIVYFILVKNVEMRIDDDRALRIDANARKESFWLLIVFHGYFLWDLITKFDDRAIARRIVVSLCCLALAWLAFLYFRGIVDPARVILADLSWLVLLLGFRAGKDLMTAREPRDSREDEASYSDRVGKLKSRKVWTLACAFVLIVTAVWCRFLPVPALPVE